MNTELVKIRQSIDQIDDKIKALFVERLSLVHQIAIQKQQNNLPVLNALREQEIISRITKDMPDQIAAHIKTLFATIFAVSRSSQECFLESAGKP